MAAYYSENDPYAAEWLRVLILEGLIAPGYVDERSIEDVTPNDLRGFTQCHFFAGIGGWSYALRLAGWHDRRPVWTGSCPCQPFSTAGKGGGFTDERHLWPGWFHLIDVCRPPIIFGEQSASKAALAWLDLVSVDLEATGYAVGAGDIPAAGAGAPHIRQRLYWVADRRQGLEVLGKQPARQECTAVERSGEAGGMGHSSSARGGRHAGAVPGAEGSVGREVRSLVDESQSPGTPRGLGDAGAERQQQHAQRYSEAQCGVARQASRGSDVDRSSGWSNPEWIYCRDGKYRPVEPGTSPLASGISGRVGLLRGYGNGICAPLAAAFIEAYDEIA
jgi:DNA (cytosine-5)-methyltransferase 1